MIVTPEPPIRLVHVDDHEAIRIGFAAIVADVPDFDLVASVATVEETLPMLHELDLVVLDLRLSDGSSPGENVARLVSRGARVLCFTGADDPDAVRAAATAGALGVVRKSEPVGTLLDALRTSGRGDAVATVDWAAALDSDPRLPDARLSRKEQEVLALYASGEKSVIVAALAGLSEKTVAEYVRRIRTKYASVGRPAYSRVDLYKRAVEDGFLPGPDGHAR